jgi:hypothetical protein
MFEIQNDPNWNNLKYPLPWWEGMIGRGRLIPFTLTPTLSLEGRGGYFVILKFEI